MKMKLQGARFRVKWFCWRIAGGNGHPRDAGTPYGHFFNQAVCSGVGVITLNCNEAKKTLNFISSG